MNKYFPIFFDISNKNILIVGSGNIAKRRLRVLLFFDSNIKIISRSIDNEILNIIKDNSINMEIRAFKEADLNNIDVVLALTNDEELNSKICILAKKNNILYNNASNKCECSFYFPSIILAEDLNIAINCNGEQHKKVKIIRKNIEERLSINNKIKY